MTKVPKSPDMPGDSPDQAAVKTLVESVATLVDRHDFITLEQLYADTVTRDYTSLKGGEPEVTTNVELMLRWARQLPGFDRTRHTLSNLTAVVTGDTGVGEADVTADHWIGDIRWTVSGHHRYDCARFGDAWRVVAQTFTFQGEDGDPSAAAKAGAAAAERPNAYVIRREAHDTVMALLSGLEDRNIDQVNGLWAEDAIEELTFAPPGIARRTVGRAALVRKYSSAAAASVGRRFALDARLHHAQDPHVVIGEYRAGHALARGDASRAIGIFRVENGKIKLFREFADPGPPAAAPA